MRVITQPTVHVIAHTTYVGHPGKRLPVPNSAAWHSHHAPDEIPTDAETLGCHAAKVCYDSFGEDGRGVRENQAAIIEHRHGSVLEHATISLHISGITRALSLELNRHRPFAISQRSTRYTREEDAAVVLDPYYTNLRDLHRLQMASTREVALLEGFLFGCRTALQCYQNQVADLEALNPLGLKGFDLRKWARGKARNVLPHALETEGVWTMNWRALRHFIETRSDRHAEAEIRRLAGAIFDAVQELAPTYVGDYTATVVDGLREFTTPHRKV